MISSVSLTRTVRPTLVSHPMSRLCTINHQPTRSKSTSPYGRSHITYRRPPSLPPPCVPEFPQVVIRSDGTSFTHYTTSPRSLIRLTRDLTNNPMWNSGVWADDSTAEEEGETAGRLGRFQRKFEELDWSSLDLGVEDKGSGKDRRKGSEKEDGTKP
jgi:hypothetical protein